MAILDYSRTLNAAGQQTPLQGMIETRKGLQGLKAGDMAMKQQQQQQEAQQAEMQRIQAARVQGAELLKSGTPEQIADFGIMNPNVMKDLIAASGFADKQAVNSRLNYAKNVLSGSVSPRDAINARIQEIEFRGGNADQLRVTAQGNEEDIIEAARKDFCVIDSQACKSYMSATGVSDTEKPAGQMEFEALIADFTPEQKKDARMIKAGLKGRAMSNALITAIGEGDVNKIADAKAQIKGAEKFAELTGASRAKAIDSGFESIRKIDDGISNIDAAIEAVNNGASTGFIANKFPSIKAASVALDNIQGKMALDVINSATFGALSEGELQLAKDIALPKGLKGPELIKHLQDKKAAQQKLRSYFNEQIDHIDQGGTVASFLRAKEREATATPETDQAGQPKELTREGYDLLPNGSKYVVGGVTYIKGQ